MRTLKKTLCLVLVLAMALSFCTVAFAAKNLGDFEDAKDAVRPYEEAVDTLVGVDLIAGVSDTELGLNEYVTREQAAKMIAYALVGEKAADAVSKQAAIFSDVEAGRWSAGYIGLCNQMGIINGYSKDVFGPEDNVTGYQFAKMLLGMVGYGQNGEYTGEAWAVNAAKDAVAKNIFKGILDSATDEAITRKEAFAMLFNAMTNCVTVDYNAPFDAYYTAGTSVVNGIDEIDDEDNDQDYKLTLGYINFGLEKSTSSNDNYGRASHYWTVDGVVVSDTFADAPDYTFTGKVTSDDLYDTIGKTAAGYTNVELWIDGAKFNLANDFWADDNDRATSEKFDIANNETRVVAPASSTTEVYVNNAANVKSVKVVIINNYFGYVSDVSYNDEDEPTTTYTNFYDNDPTAEAENLAGQTLTKATDKLAEKTYVYFTGYWDGASDDEFVVDTVAAAEKVAAAKVTAVGASYAKTADAKYTFAGKMYNTVSATSTYDLYIDNYGNLIGSKAYEEAATSLNYLYVNDYAAKAYGSVTGGKANVKIAVDFLDGTSDIVELYVKNPTKATSYIRDLDGAGYETEVTTSSTYLADPTNAQENLIPQGFYAYTVDADGYYYLKSLSAVGDNVKASTSITWEEKSAKIDFNGASAGFETATSSTKLVIVEDQVTYTGYKNFPKVGDLGLTSYNVLYTMKDGKLVNIYIFGESDVYSEDVFAIYDSYVEYDGEYYYYNLWVNGVKGEYKFDKSADIAAELKEKKAVFVIETDAKGISKALTISDAGYNLKDARTVNAADADGYYVDSDGTYIYYGDKTDDCEIYDFSGNTLKTVSSVAKDDTVVVVRKTGTLTDGGRVAVCIVIID